MTSSIVCPRCGHLARRPAPAWISRIPLVGAYYEKHVASVCAEGIEGPSGWSEACGCSHPFHRYQQLTQRLANG